MRRILLIFIALFSIITSAYADVRGLTTVVLDAGHGGHDPGAVSKDRATQEKNLTLDITKRLEKKIKEAYPEVKVVLTRSDDNFVSLGERAETANRSGANLFIAIHINASTNRSATGYSVHVLGQSSDKNRDLFANNMEVVKRENSVMMLEDDYTTKYADFNSLDASSFILLQFMQSSNLQQSLDFAQIVTEQLEAGPIECNRGIWQDPFYVLWKTSMPAVLVELGFISNATEVNILRQEENREKLADELFLSFKIYKEKYDVSVN
ncbi:MAG: N-acetylmuramoyl-L-alanine amidase [Bacteroidales bacterium]|nr:N-acetylmuramoyl-L-alanine amidase [Bacteroidales bacterium]